MENEFTVTYDKGLMVNRIIDAWHLRSCHAAEIADAVNCYAGIETTKAAGAAISKLQPVFGPIRPEWREAKPGTPSGMQFARELAQLLNAVLHRDRDEILIRASRCFVLTRAAEVNY